MSKLLQIFRPGRHTAMSGQTLDFTAADLAKTAEVYDPAKFEAPLVVGHPAVDAPAYGWVRSLQFANLPGQLAVPVLEAEPHQVDSAFAEIVDAGRYKRLSASFFLPDAPNNPVPGSYYLRHVGFLGAAAPAVQGLRPASFAAEGEGVVAVEFAELAPADERAAALAERERQLAQQEERLAARSREVAAAEAELRRQQAEAAVKQRIAELSAFCEPLEAGGRLLPADRANVVEFMAALDAGAVIEFSEADGTIARRSPLGWFKDFLVRLPKQVEYSEIARPEPGPAGGSADFATPPGYTLDQAALQLHHKATAWTIEHKCDYVTAYKAVGGK
jgi:hypothetical protein